MRVGYQIRNKSKKYLMLIFASLNREIFIVLETKYHKILLFSLNINYYCLIKSKNYLPYMNIKSEKFIIYI